ncbi:MAG: alpha/beta hydrolase [Acidobacteriales bacterium]|nr:alpha/beta hydrolase [Terriglobales bacterium]
MQTAAQVDPRIATNPAAQASVGHLRRVVTSKDGTAISFSVAGNGPALILVDGAMCYRGFGPMKELAALLTANFTVYTYDRRGRGESGDTKPYAVEREVEDIEALINHAGSEAHVFGVSSGAALALEAANRGLAIKRLVLYEAPFIVDDTRTPIPDGYLAQLNALLAANRRGDAIKLFMKLVGVPSIFIALMGLMPAWKKLKAIAHTLPYDITIVQDHQRGKPLPAGSWSSATIPTLVVEGGKSPAWMRNAMRELADVLPNANLRTLEGQTHMVRAAKLAPVLLEFFAR